MDSELRKKLEEFESLYIYGNGIMGDAVKRCLLSERIDYTGVVVSSGYKRYDDELEINALNSKKETTGILLATDEKYYSDIVRQICRNGFYNIIFLSTNEKRNILSTYADKNKLNEQFINNGGSSVYWEKRYKDNGNSGSGSYNNLAHFKAKIMNKFLAEHSDIDTCLEWGCGDGNQLSMMKYPKYIGTDVSETALNICREKFEKDETKQFIPMDVAENSKENIQADLSISLDVLFHLVEDDVFTHYMNNLFTSSKKYVCIYSSNFEQAQTVHERHRNFTTYVDEHYSDFVLIEQIPNEYPFDAAKPNETSHSDFYFYMKK